MIYAQQKTYKKDETNVPNQKTRVLTKKMHNKENATIKLDCV